jgi:hypothetical protein
MDENATSIERKAKQIGVDVREFKRQIRLHAPQFSEHQYLEPNFLYKNVYPILEKLLSSYSENMNIYRYKCGAELFRCNKNSKMFIKRITNSSGHIGATIITKNNQNQVSTNIELVVKSVDDMIANFLENELHYLHSFRYDAKLRLGLFVKGCEYPMCYMSFSDIDRIDKVEALSNSLAISINANKVIELSRVFGCGNLPKNVISFLVSEAAKQLTRYEYIITAVNLNLSFSGKSMMASGFVPYAFRPVHYSYNNNGFYSTKRKKEDHKTSPNKSIPNVLYVREIVFTNTTVRKYCRLTEIKNGEYQLFGGQIEPEISDIRNRLEKIWGENTRYHGIDINANYRISKGQCGVSSLHLARQLVNKGYNALFCEGDAIFPKKKESNEDNSIYNHCWVKVHDYNQHSKDVIIDITADQNGYSQKIIFKEEDELIKQHFSYNAKAQSDPADINVEHLIQRLEYLEEVLQKSHLEGKKNG